jgi:ATP-dependent DNA ligase
VPSGTEWLHEIKHDGFRVIARKKGAEVKLYSRPGNDLTYRTRRGLKSMDENILEGNALRQPDDIRCAGICTGTSKE